MSLYYCNSCQRVYNGGRNDYEAALRENMSPDKLLCLLCREQKLGYGQEFCELHGNEFTDFKCQYCCSIALYVCDNGNAFYCQPCFNDNMVKQLVVKTDCQGGINCGLGISRHPIGPNKFALGCSLCRSEKLGGMNMVNIAHANGGGFNLEKREDMM